MTIVDGILRKKRVMEHEVYYVELKDGTLLYTMDIENDYSNLDDYLNITSTWNVLEWNYLAKNNQERYRINGIVK